MQELKKLYQEQIVPKLMTEFGYKNCMQVPNLKKVVINVGVGAGTKDGDFIDTVANNLAQITGQKPIKTVAKKAISSFKLREGMVIGLKVTLRGDRMWDFVEKLIKITLPRVKDFRGIDATSFDGQGNYSLGLREHLPFPEIRPEEMERIHGLELSINTTAGSDKEAKSLLEYLGFPFKKD